MLLTLGLLVSWLASLVELQVYSIGTMGKCGVLMNTKKNLRFSHIFVHLTFKNNAKSTVSFKQISNNLFAPDILELNLVLTGYSPFCKSLHFKDIFFFWKA